MINKKNNTNTKLFNFFKNNNLVKYKNINFINKKKKIKIDIIILLYFYQKKGDRYYFQHKIFQHFKNLEIIFSDYIDFSYSIIGSENNLSKEISLNYFKEEEYFEFYQDTNINFCNMLFQKVNYSLKQSYKKNVDIHLWVGSNDYLCINFFKQIIEQFNDQHLMLGISNYYNGENACHYIQYDTDRFIDKDNYLHDGIHNYCKRKKYKFIGGTIGITHKTLSLYPNILKEWHFDEGKNENIILNNNNKYKLEKNNKNYIHIIKTYQCFFINTKFINDNEITNFEVLKKLNKKNVLERSNISKNFIEILNSELEYLKNLSLNIIKKNIHVIKKVSLIHHTENIYKKLIKKCNNYDIKYKVFNLENNIINYDEYLRTLLNKNISLKFLIINYELNKCNYELKNKKNIINLIQEKRNNKIIKSKFINKINNLVKEINNTTKFKLKKKKQSIIDKKNFIDLYENIIEIKKKEIHKYNKEIKKNLNKLKTLLKN